MATRVCPECGSQYVASVRRCIDCDVMLVDEVDAAGEALASVATPRGEGDQIVYELDGWGNQLRVALAGMLELNDIPYVWEVGALVVAAPHEAAVDELIAAVEGGEPEALDDEAPQIAFEIDGITADELVALDAELIAAHIPHAWQETGELLVPEESEDATAAIIDAVLQADEEDGEDGLATHAALDALYVAVDKLGKDPTDAKLVARYVDAADRLPGLGVPYGMAGQDWEELLAQVDELKRAVGGQVPGAPDGVDEVADDEAEAIDADDHPVDDGDDGDGDGDGDDDAGPVEATVGSGDEQSAPVDRAAQVAALRARLLDLV